VSIAADLQLATAVQPRECKFARVLAELNDDDRQAVESSEADHAAISRVLTANGHPVSDSTVRLHRTGNCGCSR
jgi:hypothetical protein